MTDTSILNLNEPGYIKRRFVLYIDFILGVVVFSVLFGGVPSMLISFIIFPGNEPNIIIVLIGIIIGIIFYFAIIPCYIMDGQTLFMRLMKVKIISVDKDGKIKSIKENMSFIKSIGFILYYFYVAGRSLAYNDPNVTGWRMINI